MAKDQEIIRALFKQLAADAGPRLIQAGANWQNRQLSFYYGGSPQSEMFLDIGIKKAILELLTIDRALLPREAWADLQQSINTSTVVNIALKKMADVLTHEVFPSDNWEFNNL